MPVYCEFANPRTNRSARAVRPGRHRAALDRDRSRRRQSQRNYEFAMDRPWRIMSIGLREWAHGF